MVKCILILVMQYVLQFGDIESSIIIRTQGKAYISVQLFRGFTEEGIYAKSLLVKRNRETVACVNFPSSEDVKNLSLKIRKYREGCVLECLYGGGNDLYSRRFYFKCTNDDLYLYKVVGTHTLPNSDKATTENKAIQPLVNIRDFNILQYLENTP